MQHVNYIRIEAVQVKNTGMEFHELLDSYHANRTEFSRFENLRNYGLLLMLIVTGLLIR